MVINQIIHRLDLIPGAEAAVKQFWYKTRSGRLIERQTIPNGLKITRTLGSTNFAFTVYNQTQLLESILSADLSSVFRGRRVSFATMRILLTNFATLQRISPSLSATFQRHTRSWLTSDLAKWKD
jgi:hypothetical protein